MNHKHTPGPWVYSPGNNYTCEVDIGETTVGLTRDTRYSDKYVIEREEMEANGRLIAASPDLLSLLTRIIEREMVIRSHDISGLRDDMYKEGVTLLKQFY